MDAITTMLLGFAVLRGEHLHQWELPYLDALPLEMAGRMDTYKAFRAKVTDDDDVGCCDKLWRDRQATRLYLRSLPPMTAPYMLSRLQWRQNFWLWKQSPCGTWYETWVDAPKTGPELLPPPRRNK